MFNIDINLLFNAKCNFSEAYDKIKKQSNNIGYLAFEFPNEFEYKKEISEICDDISNVALSLNSLYNDITKLENEVMQVDESYKSQYNELHNPSNLISNGGFYLNAFTSDNNEKISDFYTISLKDNENLTEEEQILINQMSQEQKSVTEKQEYDSMSGFEKTKQGVGVFFLSVGEGFLSVCENIVDGAAMAVATGARVLGNDEWVSGISNFVERDLAGELYDSTVDILGINENIAYGACHTAGNFVGMVAAEATINIVTGGAGTIAFHTAKAYGKSAQSNLQKGYDFDTANMLAAGDAVIEAAVRNGRNYIKAMPNVGMSNGMLTTQDGVKKALEYATYAGKEYAKEGWHSAITGEEYDFKATTYDAGVAVLGAFLADELKAGIPKGFKWGSDKITPNSTNVNTAKSDMISANSDTTALFGTGSDSVAETSKSGLREVVSDMLNKASEITSTDVAGKIITTGVKKGLPEIVPEIY